MIFIGLTLGRKAKGVLLQEGTAALDDNPDRLEPQAGEQLIDSLLQRAGYPAKDVHIITVTGYGQE